MNTSYNYELVISLLYEIQSYVKDNVVIFMPCNIKFKNEFVYIKDKDLPNDLPKSVNKDFILSLSQTELIDLLYLVAIKYHNDKQSLKIVKMMIKKITEDFDGPRGSMVSLAKYSSLLTEHERLMSNYESLERSITKFCEKISELWRNVGSK